MRSPLLVLLVVMITLVRSAAAQPGATDPSPYPPPPDGIGPQGPPVLAPGPPPPQQYVPVQLTAEELELLQRGDIDSGAHVAGVLLALGIGFGTGQAVQGRWADTGWKFTLGEAVSVGLFFHGIAKSFECIDTNCEADPALTLYAGLIGILVFRVWEIIDSVNGPTQHNTKVRVLRQRLGIQPMFSRVTPYVTPSRDGGGGTVGLSLRF
jgi:hypothetical protein